MELTFTLTSREASHIYFALGYTMAAMTEQAEKNPRIPKLSQEGYLDVANKMSMQQQEQQQKNFNQST